MGVTIGAFFAFDASLISAFVGGWFFPGIILPGAIGIFTTLRLRLDLWPLLLAFGLAHLALLTDRLFTALLLDGFVALL